MPHSKAAISQKNRTDLVVLSAGAGVIEKTNNGYRLTLKDVDSHALWFEDRPGRRSGFIKTARFIKLWPKAFRKSAPEAEALELINPSWNKNGDLVFKAKTLEGDKVQVGSFSDPVLLIDGVQSTTFPLWGPRGNFVFRPEAPGLGLLDSGLAFCLVRGLMFSAFINTLGEQVRYRG